MLLRGTCGWALHRSCGRQSKRGLELHEWGQSSEQVVVCAAQNAQQHLPFNLEHRLKSASSKAWCSSTSSTPHQDSNARRPTYAACFLAAQSLHRKTRPGCRPGHESTEGAARGWRPASFPAWVAARAQAGCDDALCVQRPAQNPPERVHHLPNTPPTSIHSAVVVGGNTPAAGSAPNSAPG